MDKDSPPPYYLVYVPREGLPGTFKLVLEVNREALQSETQSLPKIQGVAAGIRTYHAN